MFFMRNLTLPLLSGLLSGTITALLANNDLPFVFIISSHCVFLPVHCFLFSVSENDLPAIKRAYSWRIFDTKLMVLL